MKKKLLSVILAVVLFTSLLPASAGAASVTDFTDVKPGEWYYGAVSFAADRGLFSGMSNTTFSPNTPMNRGMFVTVLGRFAEVPKTYTSSNPAFSDITENAYYALYAAWASDLDVVSGVGNNRFAPGETISREQMAVMLFRYSMKSGINVAHNEVVYNGFSDTNLVSSYAVDALKWATHHGVINGSGGKLDPKGKATRAQVAQIFMNFFDFVTDKGIPPNPTPSPAPGPSPTPDPETPDKQPWEDYDPQYTRLTGQSAKDADGGYYDYDLANEIMDQINALRVQNGLNELAYHPKIQQWAEIRAKESSISFSHTRPNGTSCTTVGHGISSENLGKISIVKDNAQVFVDGWYNSDGHRMNMLSRVAKLGSISCYVKDGKIYGAHLFSKHTLYNFDNFTD